MALKKLAVAVATLSLLAGSAMAGTNLVGTWNGKLTIDASKLPKAANPQQAAQIKASLALFSSMKITVVISKDGSLTQTQTFPGKPASPAVKGVWKLAGNQLTLGDGKGHDKTFTVAKDGKSFSGEVGGGASIKFTK